MEADHADITNQIYSQNITVLFIQVYICFLEEEFMTPSFFLPKLATMHCTRNNTFDMYLGGPMIGNIVN